MINQIFTRLTPELYNSIYSLKSYKDECGYIYSQVNSSQRSVRADFSHCLEFGAGTGNLTDLLIGRYSSYLAVEPSQGFCDFLVSRFANHDFDFSVIKSTLQESLFSIRTFLNQSDYVLCVANFNVVNYISQDDFLTCLYRLGDLVPRHSLFIFDSWSLENVRTKPRKMSSTEDYHVSSYGNNRKKDIFCIRRVSNSEFFPEEKSVLIKFAFQEAPTATQTIVDLGTEIHTIFPYNLSALCSSIDGSCWSLKDITPYSRIGKTQGGRSVADFSSERNWYITLEKL